MTKRRRHNRGPLAQAVQQAMAKRTESTIAIAEPPNDETQADSAQVSKTYHGTCSVCGHEHRTTSPKTVECPQCGCNTVEYYDSPTSLPAA